MFDAGLILPLLGLALVDSINPSAIIVTFFLLTRENPVPKVIAYVSGIFTTYFLLGFAVLLGLNTVILPIMKLAENPIVYGFQLAIAICMFLYGIAAPSQSKKSPKESRVKLPESQKLGAIFFLGITITFVEAATALPYFGALALLAKAQLPIFDMSILIAGYNLIFIAPPLILLGIYKVFGRHIQPLFAKIREKLQHGGREAWLTIITIVGVLLFWDAMRFFSQFFNG